MYRWLNWFVLIGALAPIPGYILHPLVPIHGHQVIGFRWDLIHWTLLFNATQTSPGWLPICFTSWFLTGAIFQFTLRRR